MKRYIISAIMGAFLMRIISSIRKGGDHMVAVYVALIIYGRRTFDSVPKKFKEAVKADLEAMGLDENGQPLA